MAKQEPRNIILVVDDSPNTLRMLTDAIEGAGMTVLVALDGEQALSLIERITPDVILMDAVMPGIDGFEICRRFKRHSELSHVPVIFMTGLSETEDVIKGLDAGGVDQRTRPARLAARRKRPEASSAARALCEIRAFARCTRMRASSSSGAIGLVT